MSDEPQQYVVRNFVAREVKPKAKLLKPKLDEHGRCAHFRFLAMVWEKHRLSIQSGTARIKCGKCGTEMWFNTPSNPMPELPASVLAQLGGFEPSEDE